MTCTRAKPRADAAALADGFYHATLSRPCRTIIRLIITASVLGVAVMWQGGGVTAAAGVGKGGQSSKAHPVPKCQPTPAAARSFPPKLLALQDSRSGCLL